MVRIMPTGKRPKQNFGLNAVNRIVTITDNFQHALNILLSACLSFAQIVNHALMMVKSSFTRINWQYFFWQLERDTFKPTEAIGFPKVSENDV